MLDSAKQHKMATSQGYGITDGSSWEGAVMVRVMVLFLLSLELRIRYFP